MLVSNDACAGSVNAGFYRPTDAQQFDQRLVRGDADLDGEPLDDLGKVSGCVLRRDRSEGSPGSWRDAVDYTIEIDVVRIDVDPRVLTGFTFLSSTSR